MLNAFIRLACAAVLGHSPELDVSLSPTGEVVETYRCRRCHEEMTRADWDKKWQPRDETEVPRAR